MEQERTVKASNLNKVHWLMVRRQILAETIDRPERLFPFIRHDFGEEAERVIVAALVPVLQRQALAVCAELNSLGVVLDSDPLTTPLETALETVKIV